MVKTQSLALQILVLIILKVEAVEGQLVLAQSITETQVVREVAQRAVVHLELLVPLTLQFFKGTMVVIVIPPALFMELAVVVVQVKKVAMVAIFKLVMVVTDYHLLHQVKERHMREVVVELRGKQIH